LAGVLDLRLRDPGVPGPAVGGRHPQKLLDDGGFVVGAVVGRSSVYTCRVGDGSHAHARVQIEAVGLVSAALEEAGLSQMAFGMRITPTLEAVFDLFDCGPAVETLSPYPDSLVLVEGAVAGGDPGDEDHIEAVQCHLLPIDEVTIADAQWRPSSWRYGATEAVRTTPDAPVQGLPGSPGWIVFASNGGTERYAVDLTP
jgi:hypothetical protein